MPKRFRTKGCFPWCGKPGDCWREREEDCPSQDGNPFEFFSPEPNTGWGTISGLLYGSRSRDFYERSLLKSIKEDKPLAAYMIGQNPWEGIPINSDPQGFEVWDCDVVWRIIHSDEVGAGVVVALHHAYKRSCSDGAINQLADAIKQTLLQHYPGAEGNDRIFNSFNKCKKILAWFMVEQYQDNIEHWSAMVAKYVEFGDDWKLAMEETASRANRAKSHGGMILVKAKDRKRNVRRTEQKRKHSFRLRKDT